MKIASLNLLSPHTRRLADGTPPQEERLHQIAADIADSKPDIAVLSECRSEAHLQLCADLTNMNIACYARQQDADELIALLVRKDFAYETADEHAITRSKKRKCIALVAGKTLVIAAHYPWLPYKNTQRNQASQKLLSLSKNYETAVIAGDFNCLPWQKARRALRVNGFQSTASRLGKNEAGFPANYAKYQLPLLGSYMPKIQLDDIFVKGGKITHAEAIQTESDHPLITAEITF